MRKLLILLLLSVGISLNAQDVTATYNLSQISSYLKVGRIGGNTFHDVKGAIDSLHVKYHSVNFVIDFLETKGDYGMNAVILADSLQQLYYRMAFLIGKDTEGAAEQVAMFMRNANKAITSGDMTRGGLMPDLRLVTNDKYKTAWYDSICTNNICEKTAQEYARRNGVKAKYPTAEKLLDNFNENGELVFLLNEVAEREGVKQNDEAFYYSGFTTIAKARAELVKAVFPEAVDTYYKALNVPVQQAITNAMNVIESKNYRRIIAGEKISQ